MRVGFLFFCFFADLFLGKGRVSLVARQTPSRADGVDVKSVTRYKPAPTHPSPSCCCFVDVDVDVVVVVLLPRGGEGGVAVELYPILLRVNLYSPSLLALLSSGCCVDVIFGVCFSYFSCDDKWCLGPFFFSFSLRHCYGYECTRYIYRRL